MLKTSDFFHSVANKTLLILDLDIKTSGTGCVKIQKIECDNCKIETEKGTSVLQSIKVQRTLPHCLKRDCMMGYCQNLNTSSGDEKYSGIFPWKTHIALCIAPHL